MKKLFIMANWKAHKTFTQTMHFVDDLRAVLYKRMQLDPSIKEALQTHEYAIATPFINIPALRIMLYNHSNLFEKRPEFFNLYIASQDVSEFDEGAFTGDVPAFMIQDLGTKYVIIGHSERRRFHRENEFIVNTKAKKTLAAGMIPVICLGETIEERNAGKTKEVIIKQLETSLKDIDPAKVLISYEPIWAIGTQAASPEQANAMCQIIREHTQNKCPVLYGGSVKQENIIKLGSMPHIDGFLIGGASLKAESFADLITTRIETN
ncbi:triose-phosphate isomerase [Mycoplasmopsis columbinasalis]|uniref:Triosephosphate isomerase n=1 Tax=Mycoplasmopsis columbinasalis TaxID=114880 RepID=A0A449B9L5_9BACT|nr:triose-phosphate isomerase [Mycoplasmopsis columbinasalis]VEU77855.1 Triosephosphate isomerase [Mycoplasmopsis columbinasalis]